MDNVLDRIDDGDLLPEDRVFLLNLIGDFMPELFEPKTLRCVLVRGNSVSGGPEKVTELFAKIKPGSPLGRMTIKAKAEISRAPVATAPIATYIQNEGFDDFGASGNHREPL